MTPLRPIVCSVIVALLPLPQARAVEPPSPHRVPHASPQGTPVATHFNRNAISTVFWTNGFADNDILDIGPGFTYPAGTGKRAVYKSGVLWGGKVGEEVRVGGSAYLTGLRPGRILPGGVPEDPGLSHVRIYRVRPDYLTGDVSAEVRDEGIPEPDVRLNYQRDWTEWPADMGAPFEDRDLDGVYNPTIDVPGVPGSHQTIWYVANDLDTALTMNLYGSRPVGLELQGTVWGYGVGGTLGTTIFKSYLLINKGSSVFDSVYLNQWTDPDVGNSVDDYVGYDTTLALAYAYNATGSDVVYAPLPPPAVGYALLQGPLVPSPGDSGVFRGRRVYDRRNLEVYAHYYFTRGDATVTDPPMGAYDGTLQFYNFMRGRIGVTGAPFMDPLGRVTRFALDGDPATGTGWRDGEIFPPGDRRNGMSTGPFTMAPGDTQEVVIAQLAAGAMPGVDRLSAVSLLRLGSRVARAMHRQLLQTRPPAAEAGVSYPSGASAEVRILADGRPSSAAAISAQLTRQDGAVITSFPLYDDGLHGDGGANDGVFAATVTVAREQEGAAATLVVTDSIGRVTSWDRILDRITTAGPLELRSFRIFSDNLNNDGQANPGEDVRYGITLANPGPFGFREVAVLPAFEPWVAVRVVDTLHPGAADSMVYNPSDPASYFTVIIPEGQTDTLFRLPIAVSDIRSNSWLDTLEFGVFLIGDSVEMVRISRLGSIGSGDFQVVTVNPSQLRNHLYVVRGVEGIDGSGTPGITLKDSTDGRTLLLNHPLPDSLGHTMPVTDGFKVLLGTVSPEGRMSDWSIPSGARRWTWVGADGFGLEGFNSAIGNARRHWFSGSTLGATGTHDVLFRLAATDTAGDLLTPGDTTASLGYRYLRGALFPPARPEFAPYILHSTSGYAFQEFGRAGAPNIPFSAYDMTRGGIRLAVGHLENNVVGGSVNGRYWPPFSGSGQDNVTGSGPREWWFVFDVPYSTASDPVLTVDILNVTTPMMWLGTPNRRDLSIGFASGDEFLLHASRPPSASDAWLFNPTIVVTAGEDPVPAAFELRQNYPNPFNPSTTIGFVVPSAGAVRLTVYNMLGQQVRRLLDEDRPAGEHAVVWDGTNDARRQVAAGVYFYRIEVRTPAGARYSMVKKMVLLR